MIQQPIDASYPRITMGIVPRKASTLPEVSP